MPTRKPRPQRRGITNESSMTGPSIKNLVQIISDVSLAHPAVKEFGTGERHNISLSGGSKPIHVWLEQPFNRDLVLPQGGNPTRLFRLAVLILDIPKADKSDELDIVSRCDLVADYIAMRLRSNPPQLLRVEGNARVLSVVEYSADLWAGVRMEINILTPLPIGACDVLQFA